MTLQETELRQQSSGTCCVAGRTLPYCSVFDFDPKRWDLRGLITDFFGTEDLEALHFDQKWNPHDQTTLLPSHEVTKNSWETGKAVHQVVTETAAPTIKSLVFDHIAGLVGPIRSHQAKAMIRVNFHGSKAILRFHADKEYGQRDNVINVWLPITRVFDSNSMYVESAPGLSDFTPLELDYGQAFLFYGTELLHGTRNNMSGATRISFDFRFSI